MNYIKIVEKHENNLLDKSIYLINKFNKFYKNLAYDEKKTLKRYKLSHYELVNMILYNEGKLLKENMPLYNFDIMNSNNIEYTVVPMNKLNNLLLKRVSDSIEIIKTMDNIFKKTPVLDKIIKVYRGMSGKFIKKIKKEKSNIHLNFMSTSFSIETAIKFSNNQNIIEITLPKNIPYLYLPWNIENIKKTIFHGDEFELILPRNIKLTITKIKKIKTPINVLKTYSQIKKNRQKNVCVICCKAELIKTTNIEYVPETMVLNVNSVSVPLLHNDNKKF